MPKVHETKFWRAELPDGWDVRGNARHVTYFRPDGVGTLSLLAIEEELFDQPLTDQVAGQWSGKVSESTYGTTFCRSFGFLVKGHRVIVRYTCAAKNATVERAEVDEIIQSISQI